MQLSWSVALYLSTLSTTLGHDFRTLVARSTAYQWERQLSWSIACLPCSVSIEIQHIRSFFYPFSNQNPENPQRQSCSEELRQEQRAAQKVCRVCIQAPTNLFN